MSGPRGVYVDKGDRRMRINPENGEILSWGKADNMVRGNHQDGNLGGLRHGARSPAVLRKAADDVLGALVGNCPWVLESDVVAVEQFCRSEAAARCYEAYVWDLMDAGVDLADIPVITQTMWDRTELRAMRPPTGWACRPKAVSRSPRTPVLPCTSPGTS